MAPPRRALALERFFRAAPTPAGAGARPSGREGGAFAAIRANSALLRDAQELFDQILPHADRLGPGEPQTSNERDGEGLPTPTAVWALVAVVASGIARELKQEKGESSPATATWHLIQLLEEANVSLTEFLQYFTSLFNRLLLDPELLDATTLLKEEFTVASVLFEKYRGLFASIAPEDKSAVNEPEAEDKTVDRAKMLFDAGWLLFLLARRRLSTHYTGLGALYYLLLAVLALVLRNAQTVTVEASRSVEAEVAAALSALGSRAVRSDSGNARAASASTAMSSDSILQTLCAAPKVDPDDVRTALGHVALVLQQLQANGGLVLPGSKAPVNKSPESLASALFDGEVLEKNVANLSALYHDEYLDGCGKLDERLYLNPKTLQVITGPKPAVNVVGTPMVSSQASAAPSATPAAGTMTASVPPSGRAPLNTTLSPARRRSSASSRRDGNAGPTTPALTRGTMTPPRHQQMPVGFVSPMRQSWQWQAASPAPILVGGGMAMNSPSVRFLPLGHVPRPSPAVAQTPITAAVETSHWVRDTLATVILRPISPQLESFFADCSSNPTERIAQILNERADLLVRSRSRSVPSSSFLSLSDRGDGGRQSIVGQQARESEYSEVDGSLKRTKDLSVALFYLVLESLVLAERSRLQTVDLSSLLNNDVFIASLFACSLEVILKTNSLITLSFPGLLDTVRVKTFDFGATIESFVRHVPKLPVVLKQHMRDIEHRILDCLVWRSDSGLYTTLSADSRRAAASNGGSSEGVAETPTTASASGTRAGALRLFFRMVFSRAASRIYRLGTLLGLDSKCLNQVWTAVRECISAHHELLRDRHLDQLVLCSIYGVCKANRTDMTFKRVNESYKELQRQAASSGGTPVFISRNIEEVIRDIKLDERSRGDIIKFYNRCYVPAMKVFLLQFQMQDKQLAAADAAGATAAGSGPSANSAPMGFTPRVQGAMAVTTSASDSDIVAEAAVEAVDNFLVARARSATVGNGTPPRTRGSRTSSPFGSPSSATRPMFTNTEVQSLPVSVHHTSPKRVLASNVYMSPLQQVRLNRRSLTLTPRSHALYAFGESPARVCSFDLQFVLGLVVAYHLTIDG